MTTTPLFTVRVAREEGQDVSVCTEYHQRVSDADAFWIMGEVIRGMAQIRGIALAEATALLFAEDSE